MSDSEPVGVPSWADVAAHQVGSVNEIDGRAFTASNTDSFFLQDKERTQRERAYLKATIREVIMEMIVDETLPESVLDAIGRGGDE